MAMQICMSGSGVLQIQSDLLRICTDEKHADAVFAWMPEKVWKKIFAPKEKFQFNDETTIFAKHP